MGINSLRPFLQTLCCDSPWSYAVFWKLKHQDEMVLALEDSFCDFRKASDAMGSPIQDLYVENSNKILSSNLTSSLLDGTPDDYLVGLSVAEMSSASHLVGKGIVGETAFTGNACWIYSDSIVADVLSSILVSEYPDDWLLQFAAGIKTILLLPVMPDGVLQLGSVEVVAEDAALVACVKNKFDVYKECDGYDTRYPIQQLSLMSAFMDNLVEQSGITMEQLTEDQSCIHAFQQPMGVIYGAEPCQVSGKDNENDVLKYYHEEKLRASAHCDQFDRRMHGDFMNEVMEFHSEEGVTEPTLVGNNFDSAICESGSNLYSFPMDYELHATVGTALEDKAYPYTCGTFIPRQDVVCRSIGDREPACTMDVLGGESVGFPMKDGEVEQLLEVVVANSCTRFDDNSSKSDVTSVDKSPGKYLAFSKSHGQSNHSVSMKEDKFPWDFLASGFIASGLDTATNLSASVLSAESKISSLSDKQHQRKENDSLNRGKLSRSTTSKRRACTGDNQRPRPRDRQLIQDRIKELRELVPNSEKCSIDGLLDKTVKHMRFLRSITNQADKLRHPTLKKEADEKTMRTVEANYNRQNGTSWAVELGGEQQLCPIIVKDLEHPGHMLIEMLCTNHDRFLEIADVIYRLQLTILRGVLEKTSDSSWARFIVETSGSFHRLDIFWPLMQLLQQSCSPVSSEM